MDNVLNALNNEQPRAQKSRSGKILLRLFQEE
jgi:hypothetical protein